jgi:hypothetical protein
MVPAGKDTTGSWFPTAVIASFIAALAVVALKAPVGIATLLGIATATKSVFETD